jgi:tetratricopeptide (TPR) repeat protein
MSKPIVVVAVLLTLALGTARSEEPTVFPPEARAKYDQGQELQKKGQLDEAIKAFDEAIKLGMAAFPRVHLARAGSNFDLKKFDTAIEQYTKFIDKFGLEESCRT